MSKDGNPKDLTTLEKGHELRVVSHSDLFYWWPVWAAGFLMALISHLGNHRMAIVPAGTEAVQARQVEGYKEARDALVAPPGGHLPVDQETGQPQQPVLLMATSKNLGGLFVLILLVVTLITNVQLRGVWSLVVILLVVASSVFFAWVDWWDAILRFFGLVHIYINEYGYLAIATVLFVAWLLTTFGFDRLTYRVFSPGQFRVRREVGGGETAFDVVGMSVHKRRDDLFRHWILGLGSGDLIVRTGGAHSQEFEMPNVLFVGWKVTVIQEMLQEREVVQGQLQS